MSNNCDKLQAQKQKIIKQKNFRLHWGYLIATIVIFLIEVLIAKYGRGVLRSHVGDMIVVILIYTFIRTFYGGARLVLPIFIFIFAVCVEIGQALNISSLLRLRQGGAMSIAVGNSFDWWDILCYLIGVIAIYIWILYSKLLINKQ